MNPLAGLTSLQALDLAWCEQLSCDLAPLAGLTSLQSLNLSECGQLSDLSPLVALTSLQRLRLDYCLGFRRFAPLESLLPTLKELYLLNCKLDDLPPEVCGKHWNENVLDKVRAHYRRRRLRTCLRMREVWWWDERASLSERSDGGAVGAD